MAVWSIIQESQLEGPTRIDAEYYQPIYVAERQRLKQTKTIRLGSVAFITDGQHGYHIVDTSSNIRHITAKCVVDGLVVDEEADKLSIITHNKNLRSSLKEEDLLITTAGTVGRCGIVTKEILPANIDQDVARVHILDKSKVSPYFLLAFILSEYGQVQIRFNTTGQDRQHLALEKVSQILVPKLSFSQAIELTVQKAVEQNLLSKKLYSQAENLLLEELGLKGFKPQEDLSYVINLSDVKSARRADAEYFQPKYERIIEKIKKHDVKLLGDLVTMKKGFEPGSDEYQEEGKLFIRVSSVSKRGLIDKDQKYLSDDLYQELKKNFEPKAGEILLTKDATPGIAYVLNEPIHGIISSGIMRLKLKEDIEAEYLALCINSIIGQMQIERDAGGSIIAHWKPEQIKELQLPILPKPIQQKIAILVRQSHESRKKAKELLEEAKREVEEAIENN